MKKQEFENIENRFLCFVKILWLYNETYVNILSLEIFNNFYYKHNKKILKKNSIVNLKSIAGTDEFLLLKDKNVLGSACIIATRDISPVVFYFRNSKILFLLNGCTGLLYYGFPKDILFTKRVANNCSLYLHKAETNKQKNSNTDYEYADGKAENSTTNLVSKYSQSYGSDSVLSYDYSYDANGNITEIKQNGKTTNKYVYDSLNELKEEYDYVNKFYINYSYDGAGNLQNKYEQVLDPNYGYPTGTQHGNTYEYTDTSWKDKLTKVNGSNISYDANGNPLTYRDGMSMTWKNGRQLATLTNCDTSISYGYDSGSVRTTKTVNGVKYTYAYLNGQLMYETRGDAKFYYSYDANGILYNVRYTLTDGGTEYSYYYTHNSRGDIVGIYNGAGELKAHYEYDAWGNVISITDNNGNAITNPNHVGNLNPFRYRGYYQDTETGLYYLMSRYYDAVTHRFINADGYFQSGTSILDANTFAYCKNNPIMYMDKYGDKSVYDLQEDMMDNPHSCDYDIIYLTKLMKQGYGYKEDIPDWKLKYDGIITTVGEGAISSGIDYSNQLFTRKTNFLTQEISSDLLYCSNVYSAHQIAYNLSSQITSDITSGNQWDKVGYDIATDVLCTGAPVAVTTLIGTCVGGPVGAFLGFVAGSLISIAVDEIEWNGKTGREHIKSWY